MSRLQQQYTNMSGEKREGYFNLGNAMISQTTIKQIILRLHLVEQQRMGSSNEIEQKKTAHTPIR